MEGIMEILTYNSLTPAIIEKINQWMDREHTLGESVTYHQQSLNFYSSMPTHFVMIDRGEVIGYLALNAMSRDSAIIVDATVQGQEISQKLREKAFDICDKHFIKQVFVRKYGSLDAENASGYRFSRAVSCNIEPSSLEIKEANHYTYNEVVNCQFSHDALSYEESEQIISKAMKAGDYKVYGLYVDNILVGSSIIQLTKGFAEILRFGIHPIHQGNGYGKLGLGALMHRLNDLGVKRIAKDINNDHLHEIKCFEQCHFTKDNSFRFIEIK